MEVPYGSESYRKLNPQLFGPVGSVGVPERQCNQRGETQDPGVGEVQTRMGYRITLISLRSRPVDAHDNLRQGFKPLVDRITEWIGFKSDSDERLEWNYEQIPAHGRTGTIVLIERIP